MKKIIHKFTQSDNYDDYTSRSRHLRHVRLGYMPAVFPYCYEFGERETPAWMMSTPGPLFFLFTVDSGLEIFHIGDEEFRLEPGSIMVIPPDFGYTLHSYGHAILHVLELQGSDLKGLSISLGLSRPMLLDMKQDAEILDIIKGIGPKVDTGSTAEYCRIMGQTYEVISRLSCLVQKKGREKSVVQKVLTALANGGTQKENLEQLTKKIGISRSSINRLMKKQLGMSPKDFCMIERHKKAMALLEYTQNTVKEIAFSLGYCNPYYFSADFKRMAGRTPTEYRQYIRKLPYQENDNER